MTTLQCFEISYVLVYWKDFPRIVAYKNSQIQVYVEPRNTSAPPYFEGSAVF